MSRYEGRIWIVSADLKHQVKFWLWYVHILLGKCISNIIEAKLQK